MSQSYIALLAAFILAIIVIAPTANAAEDNDARAKRFIEYYEREVRPLEIEAGQLFWTANVTGKEEDFRKKQQAEEKIDLCLSNPERFAELKAIWRGKGDSPHLPERPSGCFAQMGTVPFSAPGVSDPLLARQIHVLFLGYLAKQVDRELLLQMRAKSNAVERAFNVFRPEVDGKKLTANDIRNILRESRDSHRRQAVWEASKKVGTVLVGDLLKLVALRNQAAHKLGFKNYHVLQLHCMEQNQEQLFKLFDQLDELTREPFHQSKAEIDAALAKNYGVAVEELRPWHYHDPFFQEAPAVLGELPDEVYKPLNTIEVCRAFYEGIGLPVDDVLKRSDLYEKPGKNPHAFSIDIDRAGDIRILENVVPGREWLTTTLHELGHAVYSKNAGANKVPPLPYLLHSDAHPLCTEGIAMMFDRFSQNVDWLTAIGAKVSDPERFRAAAAKLRRNRLLIFARWCQVMFRFEAAMYENPRQDLNRLWWDLVEKYQEIKRPDGRNLPDYAGKYHFVGAPAYYHNYMLGEMFASQVHHALVAAVLPGSKPVEKGTVPLCAKHPEGRSGKGGLSPFPPAGAIYVGQKAAGEFLKQRVFGPGLSLNWNELTRYATGAELSPKAFAEDMKIAN